MKKSITETQLILPSLMVLASKQGYLTTSELKSELRKRLTLHKNDVKKVSGNTSRFDKTVGNLISHRTLEQYVKYVRDDRGRFLLKINRKGKQFIFASMVNYVNIND